MCRGGQYSALSRKGLRHVRSSRYYLGKKENPTSPTRQRVNGSSPPESIRGRVASGSSVPFLLARVIWERLRMGGEFRRRDSSIWTLHSRFLDELYPFLVLERRDHIAVRSGRQRRIISPVPAS